MKEFVCLHLIHYIGCYYSKNMRYLEYFGRCFTTTTRKTKYEKLKNECKDGYAMPIKDDKDMEAAAVALYLSATAMYAGLEKVDGKWIYNATG